MLDDISIRAIVEALNAGESLATVPVVDLRRAWELLPRYQDQAVRKLDLPTIAELFGPGGDAQAVFIRCMLLAGLKKEGVTITDSVFERVATTPLRKDSIAAFIREIKKP